MFRKLWVKLLGVICAILFLTLCCNFLLTQVLLNESEEKNLTEVTKRNKSVVDFYFHQYYSNLRIKSKLLSEYPVLVNLIENAEENTLREWAVTNADNYQVDILDFFDSEGEFIINNNGYELDDLSEDIITSIEEHRFVISFEEYNGFISITCYSFIGNIDEPSGILALGILLNDEKVNELKSKISADVSFRLDSLLTSTLDTSSLNRFFKLGSHPNGNADELFVHTSVLVKDPLQQATLYVWYHVDLLKQNALKKTLKGRLILLGAIIFMFVLSLGYVYLSRIVKPIYKAIGFAQSLASGNLNEHLENDRDDELGLLLDNLETMKNSIKDLVDKVELKSKNINLILNNLESGFMLLDNKGIIQEGCSRKSLEFFGGSIELKPFSEILKLDRNYDLTAFMDWMDIVFNKPIPFDHVKDIVNNQINYSNRIYQLDFKPVYIEEQIDELVVIVSDISEKVRLEKEADAEREKVEKLLFILKDKEGYFEFYNTTKKYLIESNELLSSSDISEEDKTKLERYLHTIKGNASMYHITKLASTAHSIENEIKESQTDNITFLASAPSFQTSINFLKTLLLEDYNENAKLLGFAEYSNEMKHFDISPEEFEILTELICDSEDDQLVEVFHKNFITEPFLPALKKYEVLCEKLATNLEKEIKPFMWKGESIRVERDRLKGVQEGLIHVFRNIIDHAVEDPEERVYHKKDRKAQITVQLEKVENTLYLSIEDDGRGIDAEMVKSKIIEKGLCLEEDANSLSYDEIIQYIFHEGFSTKSSVDMLSGRGVGMDVVKTEVQSLGGKVTMMSSPGKGSRLLLEIPT